MIPAPRAKRRRGGADRANVVFEESEGWWVASIPGVPGACSQGPTRDEAFAMLLDALSMLEKDRELSARRPITEAEREHVERRLRERFNSSADKDGVHLAGMLRVLWGELRGRQGRDASLVRAEVRRRMRWEATVRAREDAEDHAFMRAWLASHSIESATRARVPHDRT
ncbi:MAG: type II toxin-antitoxin system HicB family antitoxin [Polyangiaceae bacterium]